MPIEKKPFRHAYSWIQTPIILLIENIIYFFKPQKALKVDRAFIKDDGEYYLASKNICKTPALHFSYGQGIHNQKLTIEDFI